MNSADLADFADVADIQKNPPNTKSAEFILTLGGNEFRRFRGFQGEMLISQVRGKSCNNLIFGLKHTLNIPGDDLSC